MSGGSHIRAVGDQTTQDAGQDTDQDAGKTPAVEEAGAPLALEEAWGEEDTDIWEEGHEERDFSWIAPLLGVTLIAAWTGLYGWSLSLRGANMLTASLEQWTGWISTWSLPVLLVATLWLLLLRNSGREAARFSDISAKLTEDTKELEARLLAVNRELSLAREFLGTQTRELESFGRIATERLSENATELQELVLHNNAQVQAIADVSETALSNMSKLRDDLPVLANSARDVSNQIGSAGHTAQEQVNGLIYGFDRLNSFGKASENQVTVITATIEATLAKLRKQLDALSVLPQSHLDELSAKADDLAKKFALQQDRSIAQFTEQMNALRDQGEQLCDTLRNVSDDTFDTLGQSKSRFSDEMHALSGKLQQMNEDASRSASERIEALHHEATRFDEILATRDTQFHENIAARQTQFEAREAEASETLSARLDTLDKKFKTSSDEYVAHAEKIAGHNTQITGKLFEFGDIVENASALFRDTKEQMQRDVESLTDQITSNETRLRDTRETLADLSEDGVRLLEILQSSTRQSQKTLPTAIAAIKDSLAAIESDSDRLNHTIEQSHTLSANLSERVEQSREHVQSIGTAINDVSQQFAQRNDENIGHIRALMGALDALKKENEAASTQARIQLSGAIMELETATKTAFASMQDDIDKGMDDTADRLRQKAIAAMESSLEHYNDQTFAALELVSTKAVRTGREAAEQLRDQLAKANELTNNLEQRVSRARELAEEQIDNDFSRRMALITDTLNSNAIDIAKALSSEVSDTAWDAYLRGDRGIFARKTVRLLDKTETRELADLYQADEDFRGHVNRFIHDFEAMLRSVLSTRDGNALGVTVIGSEVGKLYVALAQAIDRLRD